MLRTFLVLALMGFATPVLASEGTSDAESIEVSYRSAYVTVFIAKMQERQAARQTELSRLMQQKAALTARVAVRRALFADALYMPNGERDAPAVANN